MWEPADQIFAPELIQKYHMKYPLEGFKKSCPQRKVAIHSPQCLPPQFTSKLPLTHLEKPSSSLSKPSSSPTIPHSSDRQGLHNPHGLEHGLLLGWVQVPTIQPSDNPHPWARFHGSHGFCSWVGSLTPTSNQMYLSSYLQRFTGQRHRAWKIMWTMCADW
jgi:hypothetical protein